MTTKKVYELLKETNREKFVTFKASNYYHRLIRDNILKNYGDISCKKLDEMMLVDINNQIDWLLNFTPENCSLGELTIIIDRLGFVKGFKTETKLFYEYVSEPIIRNITTRALLNCSVAEPEHDILVHSLLSQILTFTSTSWYCNDRSDKKLLDSVLHLVS